MHRSTFAIILLLNLFFMTNAFPSEEIGISWEFNENGNAEGWDVFHSLTDLTVSDGMLRATVTGDFAQFVGPDFDLNVDDYGFIQIRMKAIGPESAVLQWVNEGAFWGFLKFDVRGDSLFHVYDIPAYQKPGWTGRAKSIGRLTMNAVAGSTIEIDYIRIVHVGARPGITSFAPIRTILKPGEPIPFAAVLENSGDSDGAMQASLSLPPEFAILSGDTEFDLGLFPRGENDTLRWLLSCNTVGDYQFRLKMTSADSDTAVKVLSVPIADRYWRQDKFFLSAWSPPSAWTPTLVDSSFDYYHKANFDLTLWVRPTQEAVALVAKYGMKCLINVGPLLHENDYLRAPHNKIPPPLTPEQFLLLDDVIARFKNDTTVVGYFITDEPRIPAYPNLGKVVAYLRKRDPERLCYINLFPSGDGYDNYVQQFLEIVKPEILSYDRYTFFKDHDGGSYFSNLAVIRKWALRYAVPFCNIVQAIGTDFSNLNWRTPSEAEHRWLAYSSLAYGAKGLIWFHWDGDWGVTGSPDRDQIFASLQKLNGEINCIGPVMIGLQTTAVYHSSHVPYGGVALPDNVLVKSVSANADLVVGLFKNDVGRDFVMLMNKNYHDAVTATITLNRSVQSLKYFNVDAAAWQDVDFENTNDGAVFASALRAGGGRLYAIGEETAVEQHGKFNLPQEFHLGQNYPNPFNPQTSIEYEIPQNAKVKLTVRDVLGRKVAVMVDKRQQAGAHKVVWDAAHVPSGVYVYTLQAGEKIARGKMLLIR